MPNKKSLPNKMSLVEVSFEIVLVEISPQHFLSGEFIFQNCLVEVYL